MPGQPPTSSAVRIGTSGWSYSHWRGRFYEVGLKPSQWLPFYASRFDTVEINATFYRLPRPEYVEAWRQATPEQFLFAVKGSRYLTHIKRLAVAGEPLERFFRLAALLGDKAGPVLWQLPPSLERDDERLAAFLGELPSSWRHAFEFRHPSWFCRPVYDVLSRSGAALCWADHPERPAIEVLTAGWSYLRFHYGEQDGCYSTRQLQHWAGRLRLLRAEGVDVYAYFNNDWQGYALQNAAELRRLLQ